MYDSQLSTGGEDGKPCILPTRYETVEGETFDRNKRCRVDHYRTFCLVHIANSCTDDVKYMVEKKWECLFVQRTTDPDLFFVGIRSLTCLTPDMVQTLGFPKVTRMTRIVSVIPR